MSFIRTLSQSQGLHPHGQRPHLSLPSPWGLRCHHVNLRSRAFRPQLSSVRWHIHGLQGLGPLLLSSQPGQPPCSALGPEFLAAGLITVQDTLLQGACCSQWPADLCFPGRVSTAAGAQAGTGAPSRSWHHRLSHPDSRGDGHVAALLCKADHRSAVSSSIQGQIGHGLLDDGGHL